MFTERITNQLVRRGDLAAKDDLDADGAADVGVSSDQAWKNSGLLPSIEAARRSSPTRRGVTGPEAAAGPRCPSMLRTNGPTASGQILPDLTRAICGYLSARGWSRAVVSCRHVMASRRSAATGAVRRGLSTTR